MNKIYFVESELCPKIRFNNESDRNEMALALWQEHCYFLGVRAMNWYDDPIMTGIKEDAMNNVYTWECQTWFNAPTQVAYWDIDGDHYIGGIAYGDEIICGCCGGVISIEEVIEFAPECVNPIVAYDDWEDIDTFILGDNERYFGLET